MEQRRFFAFFVLSMLIWFSWTLVIGPAVAPNLFPKIRPKAVANFDESDQAADALRPANVLPEPLPEAVAEIEKPKAAPTKTHPVKIWTVGGSDPEINVTDDPQNRSDEYFLATGVTSQGAAIDFIELTDKKRYPAFNNRRQRAKVLGSDPNTLLRTFTMKVPEIDKQLNGASLDILSWEVVPQKDPELAQRAATFRYVSPDGQWELQKHFELAHLDPKELAKKDADKTLLAGYELKLTLTVRNLTKQAKKFTYSLQGPVGVPLEDQDNTSKFRDIRMGFRRDDGSMDETRQGAAEAVKKEKADKTEVWNRASAPRKLKYIGVDVMYFAALVLPGADQLESADSTVTYENRKKPEFSDVSVELNSRSVEIDGGDELVHEYTLFAGPKQKTLIQQIPAMAVMDYGWFDSICRGMLWLLNMFHEGMGLSYGIAIICLTALVRTLLLPISKHQAANAAKMKVLQPKVAAKQKELEAKYGKNTEEYMKHAQDLTKEQLGLMMSGCLPIFLQLPIFIALYRAISSSIDLRMEPFLWFENLASPDALFRFPFLISIPIWPFNGWPGWTDFNLLPCISTGLMFVHQKMTMPPPTNEEQAQQQKMMNFMMIFMGAMFFRVPSGLCLYFIATNVWSMTERWLFEHLKSSKPVDPLAEAAPEVAKPTSPGKPTASADKQEESKPSAFGQIWNRLQEAADNHHSASRQLDNSGGNSTNDRNKKKKKKR